VSSLEEKSGNPQPESLQVLSSEVEYRSLGPAEWKGEKVHMYQRTERKKTVGGATGNVTDRVNVTKYWVNADGLIYRSEFRAESRSNARTSVTAVVTEREAVPGLTFSEPLVDAHP
jgi:hypothetical protein